MLFFDFAGVTIIVITGAVGIYNYVRHDANTRLKLAKGLATALDFKLGSEILRTVVIREINEILIVGSIIILRAALSFLIHWEIKEEETGNGVHGDDAKSA